ncbi:MAG: amino acid adenylation domain-containing protein, partial [Acidobacteria bacterium]|nr:amino acid adenylation domain-containing protein [Acidobacteriota bacterium]
MSGAPKLEGMTRQEKLALLARLSRRPKPRRAPLSFAQQRLWFLDRLDPGSHVHTIFRAYRLSGPLSARALARSFAALHRRHDALRTTFVETRAEGSENTESRSEVVQQVAPAPEGEAGDLARGTWIPGVVDLTRLAAPRGEDELEALAARFAKKPFDLATGPMARVALVRLGTADHGLLLALHHIVADGWSMGILFSELATLYGAFAAAPGGDGAAPALPELKVQYPDYSRWQREELDLDAQLAFWKDALGGAPTVLELPADHPRPAVESFRGEYVPLRLSPELRRGLEELGRRHGATLFMTFLAGFAAFLARITGRRDLLLGTPVANRQRAELEGVVGSFANTLVLRAELEDEPSFTDLLTRLRRHTLSALAHQDLPFERLVEALEPRRDLSRNPVFQVMFALLQTAGGGSFALPGLDTEPLGVGRGLSKVDLTLEIYPDGEGLGGYFEYAADLFDEGTVERWAAGLEVLLAGAVAEPATAVAALPLLPEAERRQLLVEWNRGEAVEVSKASIPELWAERVRATPGAPALVAPGRVDDDGDRTLTFAELDALAGRVAGHLAARGVGPGDRVALLAERSAEALAAILGILETGAAYVPLDPAYPPQRLAFMIEDADVAAVLAEERLAGTRTEALGDASGEARPRVLHLEPCFAGEAPRRPARRALPPESAAYSIYTSGSTGRPKGVVVPHRAVAHLAAAMGRTYGLAPGDRVLQFASLSFDISVEEIFPTLLAGATLVLRPPELSLAMADFFRFAAAHRLSVVNVPTPYWHEWISELAAGRLELPTTLRLVIVGTEQALPERLAGWLEATGGTPRWINAYGPSETTVTATVFEAGAEASPTVERVPIGRPIANARAYVLDRHRRPLPVGVPGQLWLAGGGLAQGYFRRPALTAERFGPDPFAGLDGSAGAPGDRLYATGDLARWLPDGHIEFLGRVDRQVKIRGFRVETGEIEAALVEHPALRQAVVEALSAGAGDRRLVAWVVGEEGRVPGAAELREHLGKRLPAYMVPSAFVPLAELPMTPSGKIDRRALPAPEATGHAAAATGEAPRGAVEELVAEVWCEVLGRPALGRTESFFELGGHS